MCLRRQGRSVCQGGKLITGVFFHPSVVGPGHRKVRLWMFEQEVLGFGTEFAVEKKKCDYGKYNGIKMDD